MSFRTFMPCEALRPFVKAFAISESAVETSYKVIPDISIVMGFQYSGRLGYVQQGQHIPLSMAGITGLMDSYRVFHNSSYTATFLVIFKETGASAFFKTPLHEIFGQSIALDNLLLHSQMDAVCAQLHDCNNDLERIAVVERFLGSLLNPSHDALVTKAVQWIQQHGGQLKINMLAKLLNISQSQLEKRFRKTVGCSPKKFSSITRLRTLLDSGSTTATLAQRGLDAGYFDQAHFIKDFKTFTGQSPEDFFDKG